MRLAKWRSLADAHYLGCHRGNFAKKLRPHSKVALRDPEGVMLGVLHVEDVCSPIAGRSQ